MKEIKAIWPKGKKFAVCLTHDVDRVKKTYQCFTHFLKDRNLRHLSALFKRENPYWNFERIMEIERRYQVKSTFFFLEETKGINLFSPKEIVVSFGKYRFNDEEISKVIKMLACEGWEVALHGSYWSYKSKEKLAQEKKKLEEVCGHEVIGVRQHYLNLSIPQTWELHKEVGLKYDASFGSNEELGFKDNRMLPFKPFSDEFLVLPLTVMDFVLFKRYRKLHDAWEKCKELIKVARGNNGFFSLLWHQRVFNEREFPGWGRVYEDIIAFSLENDAWVTSAKEIVKWWIAKKAGSTI